MKYIYGNFDLIIWWSRKNLSQKEFQIIVWRWNILTVLVLNSYFRPMRIFHTILPGSLPQATIKKRGNILSPSSTQAFWAGQTCPVFLSLRFLAAGRTSQYERPHWLFFTDSLSHISSSLLSTMRRPHPIYGPLVSGKSFFHHSSFLLNQWIFRELDIFNSCF